MLYQMKSISTTNTNKDIHQYNNIQFNNGNLNKLKTEGTDILSYPHFINKKPLLIECYTIKYHIIIIVLFCSLKMFDFDCKK